MDAKATLLAANQAVSDGDLEAAGHALADYWQWRGNGGFEPELWGQRGDRRAREISQRLEGALIQRGTLK